MTRPPSLLAVFAHPDDESLASGGLFSWCAALGAQVSLLCLTHGEHGHAGGGPPADDRSLPQVRIGEGDRDRRPVTARRPSTAAVDAGEDRRAENRGSLAADARTLRQVRADELRAAARVLGIGRVRLLDHEDGMLPWIPPDRLDADIRDEIRRTEPDVVVTFDTDGLYWHPDHVAVHERTTAVVTALPGRPPALFYAAVPPGAMRAVVDHAARVGAARGLPRPFARSILGVADPDAFGAGATPPTHVVHARAHAVRKLRALHCHRSQFHDCALRFVDPADAPRLLGTEHYRRAEVGTSEPVIVDRLTADGAGRR